MKPFNLSLLKAMVFSLAATLTVVPARTALAQGPTRSPPRPHLARTTDDWVSVGLEAPPLTRVRCSFDRGDGAHEEVDWDPTQLGPLVKVLRLRDFGAVPNPGARWTMACSAEQLALTGNGPAHVMVLKADDAVARPAGTPVPAPSREGSLRVNLGTNRGIFGHYQDIFEDPKAPAVKDISVRVTVASLANDASLQTILKLPPGAIPPLASGRALDPISPIATELLQVIAEIAVDRAKSQAAAFLTENLRTWVCDKLVWTPALATALGVPADRTPVGMLLPRTCEAITHLRIQEIAASAETVYRDLVTDLTSLAMQVVVEHASPGETAAEREVRESFQPVLASVARLLANLAGGHSPSTERDAQQLLSGLADVTWTQLACPAAPDLKKDPGCFLSCGVEAAIQVMDECHRVGRCGPDEITTTLLQLAAAPSNVVCKPVLTTIERDWPEFSTVVLHGFDILRPPQGTAPKQIVRNAVNLMFDLQEHAVCVQATSTDIGPNSIACTLTKDARVVANGAFDQDLQHAILGGAALLSHAIAGAAAADREGLADHGKTLRKVTAVIGAVAAYSATYSTDPKGDAEKVKAQHEERKKAISAMIDATTERSARGNEWVFSVGVMPGVTTGGEWLQGVSPGNFTYLKVQTGTGHDINASAPRETSRGMAPTLTLPMGVAAQYLPKPIGFHIQVSPIDVGQFVAVDFAGKINKPRADTLFTASVQAGMLLGSASSPVLIGADFRYTPTLYADNLPFPSKGVVRFGALIGFYVPFFDFN